MAKLTTEEFIKEVFPRRCMVISMIIPKWNTKGLSIKLLQFVLIMEISFKIQVIIYWVQAVQYAKKEHSASLLRKTTDWFIQKAHEVHGNKYDYSKVNYVNSEAL